MERIDKILANNGYGTRKEVKQLIKWGVVKADGVTVKSADAKFDPAKTEITVNGERLNYRK